MKFLRTTGLLWLIVGLVGGYAYFYEYKGKNEQEAQELENKKLVRVELDSLTKIQIKSSRGELVLEKNEGIWRVQSPYQDLADNGAIQNLYNALSEEKIEETIVEGEGIDKSLYGFTDNLWIELSTGDKTTRIDVGTVNGLSGKKYLVLNNESKVVLGSFTWDSLLNKEPNEFRKKDIFDFTESQIENIQYVNLKNQKKLVFENKDGLWSLKDFKTNDLDRSVLEGFVSSLLTLRASQIDEVQVAKKPLLAKFSIKSKQNDKNVEFRIYEPEGALSRAEVSGRPVAFKVSSGVLAAFNKSMDDFRDRKQPLKFDREKVDQIEYVSEKNQISIKKQGSSWVSLDNKQVDSAEVERLLNKLSQLKVKNFLGKDIPFQKSGATQLKLKSGETDLLELEWSPRVIKDVFVTKSSIFDEYVGLLVQDIESLPTLAILKDETTNSKKLNKDAQ